MANETVWVSPVVLSGKTVRLEPLDEKHAESLARHADTEIFRFFAGLWPQQPTRSATLEYIRGSLKLPARLSFATILQSTGEAIGSTAYMDIRPEHRGLEIGSTWISREHQGTLVNPECKYLLLRHAFEALIAQRVQLKTDSRNLQSQAAMRKLGAIEEGILRSHMICDDGHIRDTVMFSVTSEEWPALRTQVRERLGY